MFFSLSFAFFFNDTATTEIYTLSLHDALPISAARPAQGRHHAAPPAQHDVRPRRRERADRQGAVRDRAREDGDRKSTRLNSSHTVISYAVFCLKKKKKNTPAQKKHKQQRQHTA